jgi:hypothetical protein
MRPGTQLFQYQAGQDPVMGVLNAYPPFRRAWLRGYKDLVNGPMIAANVNPVIDARYNSFLANGMTPASPQPVKDFIATARTTIAALVAQSDIANLTVANTTVTAASNLVTLTGAAQLDIVDIRFNGVSIPVTWTSITNWSGDTSVRERNDSVLDRGLRCKGNRVGATNQATVTFTGQVPDPRGSIVFNEIMFEPIFPDAEYIEFYNRSTSSFDLNGWRINGLDYTFPRAASSRPGRSSFWPRTAWRLPPLTARAFRVHDQFSGGLQADGETLTLVKPGATPAQDVVVDKVRYEGSTPWPALANGTGSAIQLLDSAQDNSRPLNWFASYTPAVLSPSESTPPRTNDGWRFVSITGTNGTVGGTGVRLLMGLASTETGSALIDDISYVDGSNAAVGFNFVRNGDFETPFFEENPVTNSWVIGTNYFTNSTISTSLVHSGNGALRMVCDRAGSALNLLIYQNLSPAPTNGQQCTLSFWFWATNTATNITMRIQNSATLNTNVNINVQIIRPITFRRECSARRS